MTLIVSLEIPEKWQCTRCKQWVSPGEGAADDMPDVCDTCWSELHSADTQQGGAEEAPMDSHLLQIAQLLVDSADVDTDASDVADGASIVGTVKRALEYLDAARDDNRIKYERIKALEAEVRSNKEAFEALKVTEARLNNEISRWRTGANELQDKYLAAQQEIGALNEQLSAATRNAKRWEDEAANNQARYEGMEAALRTVLELAGVGK